MNSQWITGLVSTGPEYPNLRRRRRGGYVAASAVPTSAEWSVKRRALPQSTSLFINTMMIKMVKSFPQEREGCQKEAHLVGFYYRSN